MYNTGSVFGHALADGVERTSGFDVVVAMKRRRIHYVVLQDLREGTIDPLRARFLHIDVFAWPGHGFFTIRNRRLHCLREYQNRNDAKAL